VRLEIPLDQVDQFKQMKRFGQKRIGTTHRWTIPRTEMRGEQDHRNVPGFLISVTTPYGSKPGLLE